MPTILERFRSYIVVRFADDFVVGFEHREHGELGNNVSMTMIYTYL